MKRYRTGGLFLILILAGALAGGWFGDGVRAGGEADDAAQLDQLLKTFSEALATVESNYAQEVDSDELLGNAIHGMLNTLDPHSSYFAAPDYSKLREEQQGQYYGLGISIRPERPGTGRIRIVQPPSEGTPAARVGLRHGDIISRVNAEPIDDWTVDEVISKLKGPKGTTVDITVERPGADKPIDLTVERDAIPIYTIRYAFHVRPGIGYVRIDRFSETTSDELDQALAKLDAENLDGLILDLRNNPGGSLRQSIEVSDRFLEREELIVSTRGRGGELEQRYRAPRGRSYDYPMVVLINRHSASASEIVSGALQDHDRALILGETSFGKALVQTVFTLDDNRGLALTTGKYYTPSDRLIQRPYQGGNYDWENTEDEELADEVHLTDAGRKVFGGGGIKPDVVEKSELLPKLAARASYRNLYYFFSGKLIRGEVDTDKNFSYAYETVSHWPEEKQEELAGKLTIDPKGRAMELFRDFLKEKDIEFTEDEFEESRDVMANRLEREVFLAVFGESRAMRVTLEIDNQVQRAIELMPKASALFDKAQQAKNDD
ncbi:MAG TPA: S41 family peptidase [Acidobacteriota bacterium]|nr:S41 family peptidase [Acidobacteriota bacterium]